MTIYFSNFIPDLKHINVKSEKIDCYVQYLAMVTTCFPSEDDMDCADAQYTAVVGRRIKVWLLQLG